jgi:hypothetical protein
MLFSQSEGKSAMQHAVWEDAALDLGKSAHVTTSGNLYGLHQKSKSVRTRISTLFMTSFEHQHDPF